MQQKIADDNVEKKSMDGSWGLLMLSFDLGSDTSQFLWCVTNVNLLMVTTVQLCWAMAQLVANIQGGPQKVSHYQMIKNLY